MQAQLRQMEAQLRQMEAQQRQMEAQQKQMEDLIDRLAPSPGSSAPHLKHNPILTKGACFRCGKTNLASKDCRFITSTCQKKDTLRVYA